MHPTTQNKKETEMVDSELQHARQIGGAIRIARREKKLTAEQVADRMTEEGYRMNRDGVLRVENGKARLGFAQAINMAKIIDMKLSHFME